MKIETTCKLLTVLTIIVGIVAVWRLCEAGFSQQQNPSIKWKITLYGGNGEVIDWRETSEHPYHFHNSPCWEVEDCVFCGTVKIEKSW